MRAVSTLVDPTSVRAHDEVRAGAVVWRLEFVCDTRHLVLPDLSCDVVWVTQNRLPRTALAFTSHELGAQEVPVPCTPLDPEGPPAGFERTLVSDDVDGSLDRAVTAGPARWPTRTTCRGVSGSPMCVIRSAPWLRSPHPCPPDARTGSSAPPAPGRQA